MFSANENLMLRQHKRRVVGYVEGTMAESILDLGVNVMVMQVNCTAPGCVPIETCIIIVFPSSRTELIPGLPESAGGSYKTKVLVPMADVTHDDVLDVLPPEFVGGRKPTTPELCVCVRDVMLGQITQVFGDMTVEGRTLVARYLQTSLDAYVRNDCEPPPWGESFPNAITNDTVVDNSDNGNETWIEPNVIAPTSAPAVQTTESTTVPNGTDDAATKAAWTSNGNVVIRRPVDSDDRSTVPQAQSVASLPPWNVVSTVNSVTQKRQQHAAVRSLQSHSNSSTLLAQLSQREHAPGIRRPGCPCCDPDSLSTLVNHMLSQI